MPPIGTTATLSLAKFAPNARGWDADVNANWDAIDAFAVASKAAGWITSGVFDAARIPLATALLAGAVLPGANLSFNAGTGALSLSQANVEAALGYTPIDSALIGAANGVASLDANGKVPTAQIPPQAISNVVVVADDTARFALANPADIQVGDFVKVTATGKTYILKDADPSLAGSYLQVEDANYVVTVNGQSGNTILLTTDDVGEGSSNLYFSNARAQAAIDKAHVEGVLTGEITTHTHDTNYLKLSGGTLTNFLTLHADPTTALHAATKGYVDTADALKLNLSGGTMTGFITLNADPSLALHAASKQYVDNQTATRLALTGGTLTGDVTVQTGAMIVIVDAPVDPTDAANKAYVDAQIGATAGVTSFNTRTGAITLTAGDVNAVLIGEQNSHTHHTVYGRLGVANTWTANQQWNGTSHTIADGDITLSTTVRNWWFQRFQRTGDAYGDWKFSNFDDDNINANYLIPGQYTAIQGAAHPSYRHHANVQTDTGSVPIYVIDATAGAGFNPVVNRPLFGIWNDGVQKLVLGADGSAAFGGAVTLPGAPTLNLHAATKAYVDAVAATAGVTSFNTRTGAITLLSADVTGALGYTPFDAADLGQANGAASLGPDGKIPSNQIPAYAVSSVTQVADQTARFALVDPDDIQVGDFVKQVDTGVTYIYAGTDPSQAANWVQIEDADYVLTVNGQSGTNVVLTTDDIAEDGTPNNQWFTVARAQAAITKAYIESVLTGDITSHHHDSTYLKLAGGTLTGALTLAGAPTVDLHAATKKYVDDAVDVVLGQAGVTSFNTRTGAITLTDTDVNGALGYTAANAAALDASALTTGEVPVAVIPARIARREAKAFMALLVMGSLQGHEATPVPDYDVNMGGAKSWGKMVISSASLANGESVTIDILKVTATGGTGASIFTTKPVLNGTGTRGDGHLDWATVLAAAADDATLGDDDAYILKVIDGPALAEDLRVSFYEAQ